MIVVHDYYRFKISLDDVVELMTMRNFVTKGFKSPFCALIFCAAFEEIHQFFRMKNKLRGERCKIVASRINNFNKLADLAT